MSSLIELGTLRDLETVARDMKDRLARRGLDADDRLVKVCGNILIDHPMRQALVLPAGLRVRGDLVLEDRAFADNNISTIAVQGDLVIDGRIVNEDADGGPFLLVDGDLITGHVAKGGASFAVLGSLKSSGVIFCDSGYGALVVGNDIEALAVIANDQEVYAGGNVSGIVVSDELGNMREMLVPEVFEEPDNFEDEWPDGNLIRERMAADLPVLKTR